MATTTTNATIAERTGIGRPDVRDGDLARTTVYARKSGSCGLTWVRYRSHGEALSELRKLRSRLVSLDPAELNHEIDRWYEEA
jgi:hypothetical protein